MKILLSVDGSPQPLNAGVEITVKPDVKVMRLSGFKIVLSRRFTATVSLRVNKKRPNTIVYRPLLVIPFCDSIEFSEIGMRVEFNTGGALLVFDSVKD